MPEYIECEALKEDVKNHFKKLIDEGYVYDEIFESNAEILRIIDAQPTADVTEVKHGKWKINSDGYYPYCSECNNEPENGKLTKYCPNCGAKMDKE